MTDKQMIDTCRKLVEEKFQLPASGSWKQRDFQYLSDLIFEKTSIRLSLSTLKRIWKDPAERNPQLYTLNALARLLGHDGWNDFKRSESPGPAGNAITIQKSEIFQPGKKIYILLVGAALMIACLAFFYFRSGRPSFRDEGILFKSRKNVATGVPNTVVFEYDISKADFDSAFIQHTWDKRMRARVSGENHTQTFIYYYPGYHTAKLTLDNKIVKQERVNISTAGWEAIVDDTTHGRVPSYIPAKEIVSNGRLYVSEESIRRVNAVVDRKDFFVNYFNVGNFKAIDGNNFTLETRLKNSLQEGALICQYCQLTVICENSLISIPFCHPGCAANIHLHTSDIIRDGKKNDLTPFGIDLSDWRNITIRAQNKEVTVFVDGSLVYTVQFTKDIGRITGLHYKFYGNGSVDAVRLYTQNKELSYSDDFSN